jgi:hypothetical protein
MTVNIDVTQLLLVQVMAIARYGEHVFVTELMLVTAVTANVMMTQLVHITIRLTQCSTSSGR